MKKLVRKSLFLLTTFIIYHPSCEAQTFYATLINSGLIKIDLSTCMATLVGYSDSVLIDIALCSDKKLYGTDGFYLYEIDTSNASLTPIGQKNFKMFGNNLVCDSAGNLLSLTDSLYQISRITAQGIGLGRIQYASAGDLTFYNDNLYLSATNNGLVKISLPSVTAQLVGIMNATNVYGLNTFCFNGYETMVATGGNYTYSSLYKVNATNGNLSVICDTIVHDLIYGAASLKDINSEGTVCIITNLMQILSNPTAEISPNPFHSSATFMTSTDQSNGVLRIYNQLGVLITAVKLNRHSTIINRDIFANGIYFYQVVNNKEIVIRGKFVVD